MARAHLQEVLIDLKWPYVLKEEQISALEHVYNQDDTLVILPTGFGKSDIMIISPYLLDKVVTLWHITCSVNKCASHWRKKT